MYCALYHSVNVNAVVLYVDKEYKVGFIKTEFKNSLYSNYNVTGVFEVKGIERYDN